MKKHLKIVVVLSVLIFSSLSQAGLRLSVDEMLSDFSFLNAMIESGYGPMEYKKDTQEIDFQELKKSYAQKIELTNSNEEFYYQVIQYIGEFHDGHFGAALPTDFESNIGIHTDLFRGKVLITDIDRKEILVKDFPAQVGDEIVALDGVDISSVLNQLKKAYGSGYELTERRIGSWLVFHRRASKLAVPRGQVKVSVRRGDTNILESYMLNWLHKGTELVEVSPELVPSAFDLGSGKLLPLDDYDQINLNTFLNDLPIDVAAKKYMCQGWSRVAVPQGATFIIKKPFVAYYYPTAKGNIGYLRIPHYSPKNKITGEREYELRFKQYQFAVAALEKETVGLIIDQDSNCGGSVSYLEKMIGLFMTTDYKPMQFKLLASKESYLDFKDWMSQFDKHTLDYASLKVVSDLVMSYWLAGDFMTPLTSIHGRLSFAPNIVHYTKPIIVLIDEMAGSGGDAFPSLIQGFGRAKLLGIRTSGLGGHVTELAPLPFSRIKTRMTRSLFFRPDGVAVENNGAVPDYNYAVSRADLLHNYLPYRSFYTQRLLEMLPEVQ